MLKKTVQVLVAVAALATMGIGATRPAAAAPLAVTVVNAGGAPVLLAERHDRHLDRRDRYVTRGCAPRQALRKAQRLGLHRPVIVRDNRRAVVVDGRKRGHVVTVRFAQVRGCPILRVR